jgi:phage terminase large subunit GpA-like protein
MAMDLPGDGLDAGVAAAGGRGLRPSAALTVSEWAETYRVWAGRSVAEAGRYRIARTPYIREPLDCLSEDSPVQRLVVMKAARLGFTEGVVLNTIGYYLHHAPAPCLLVLPTLTMAQRVARESLEPMLLATPELRVRLGTPRGRGELRSTLLLKEVPNGSIALVGANSAAALRQTAAKIVLVDELDACPRDVEGEGSPLAIAEARARTFGPTRKVVLVSSPTERGRSLIETEYEQTDKRVYQVPCPHCEARQVLTLDGLTWEPGQPETAHYQCSACRRPIGEGHKAAMVAAGAWMATAQPVDHRRRGYHLSSLYSPSEWFTWADVARTSLAAERDPSAMKPFQNTVLGLCYAERMEQLDWEQLAARQTPLPLGVVPPGVYMLCAGVDVQDEELQVTARGTRSRATRRGRSSSRCSGARGGPSTASMRSGSG